MALLKRKPYQGDPRQQSNNAKYTKGGELMLNGENYIGPYHIYGIAMHSHKYSHHSLQIRTKLHTLMTPQQTFNQMHQHS